jgi:hypothetical protein
MLCTAKLRNLRNKWKAFLIKWKITDFDAINDNCLISMLIVAGFFKFYRLTFPLFQNAGELLIKTISNFFLTKWEKCKCNLCQIETKDLFVFLTDLQYNFIANVFQIIS